MMAEGATEAWLAGHLGASGDLDRRQVLELTHAHLSLANVGRSIVALYGELLSDAGPATPSRMRLPE